MRALRILGAFLSVVFPAITINASEANLRSGELEVVKEAEHGASARNLATKWYYGSCDVSTVGVCIDTNVIGCSNKLYSLFCMDHAASILCCSNDDPDFGSCNGIAGTCIDTTRDSCSKTTEYGYCPGDNDIMCCPD